MLIAAFRHWQNRLNTIDPARIKLYRKQSGPGTRVGVPQVRVLWQNADSKWYPDEQLSCQAADEALNLRSAQPGKYQYKNARQEQPACRVCLSVGFLCWRPSRYDS